VDARVDDTPIILIKVQIVAAIKAPMLADANHVLVGCAAAGAAVAPIDDVLQIAIADITVASTDRTIATQSIVEAPIFLSLRIKLIPA
jgi:hypothetical protein